MGKAVNLHFLAIFLLTAFFSRSFADVKLPTIFSDNMVLQQNQKLPIWGKASPYEKIHINFGFSNISWHAVASDDGKWKTEIGPFHASFVPQTLTVKGNNTVEIKNVLVGEVWLASGQSNMQMGVLGVQNAEQEIKNANNYPNIRLCTIYSAKADTPQDDFSGLWQQCSSDSIKNFSATCYFFGKELYEKLNVPIGLINSSWGGTPAEAWTPADVMKDDPDFKWAYERYDRLMATMPEKIKKWQEEVEKWKVDKAAGKEVSHEPWEPAGERTNPSVLYNAMIHPLIPFRIAGVIWYQGESNADYAWHHEKLFMTLITSWRQSWGQGDFPFYFVQLANYTPVKSEPGESDWAELRETQLKTLQTVPNTGMAVIIDIGEADDIHPQNKQDVGKRLSLWALANTYGHDIVYSGPTFKSMEIKDDKAILRFDHVGLGLTTKDNQPLKGFAIAGADKKFVWADAEIVGNKVIIKSDKVPVPVAVRYGWAHNPVCNLYNEQGLPATPFRTDDWPGLTYKKK